MTLNKKLFFVIWTLGVLRVLAVLPYLFEIQAEALAATPLSLPVVALASVAQSAVLFGIATSVGLYFAKKVGFQFPVLELLLSGNGNLISWLQVFALPAVLGITIGLLVFAGDCLFAFFGVILDTSDVITTPIWKKFLGSFYGGIGEEILLRLCLVSLFVWLLAKMVKYQSPLSHSGIVWTAIITAAVLFGIGHLPATALITEITPPIVARAIILNGIAGLILGWLLEKCKIKHRGYHATRHSWATDLLKNGVPITVVSGMLGHEQVSTTLNTYSHFLPGMQDQAVKAIKSSLG
jgi:Phage integrase family/Type II CAAX prenyl endopeptidase Rce1-like